MTAPTDESLGGWEAARDEGIRLLEERDLAGAVKRLADAAPGDASGESEALLGLAHFHSERYDEAARHYAKALEADANQPDWRHMIAACEANADAEVNVAVPDVHYFDRDELLGPPPPPSLPKPPRRRFRLGIWRRVRYLAGHAIGRIGGGIMSWLTGLVGKNYRGEVWTNWYRKRL